MTPRKPGDITGTQADRLRELVSANPDDFTRSEMEELKGLRDTGEVDALAV